MTNDARDGLGWSANARASPRCGKSAVWFVVAFFAVCYLVNLGQYPLVDPDEPVYAETGKLMALSRAFAAWWTPHYNGHLWFDKPPVAYWLVGLSMKVLGVGEFAARLPMALAALALVWLTAELARSLFPRCAQVAPSAAFIVGSCAQTLMLAHACVTDMFLAVSLTAALLYAWRWLERDTWPPILISGAWVGLGVLIKGPVAIVLIGSALLIHLLLLRQGRRFMSLKVWLSLVLALGVCAPWYGSMIELHGSYFVNAFLEAQNIGRYLTAEHAATASPLFFIPVLLLGFLPWTFAVIPALAASFDRARLGAAADRFALTWIVLVFVFFSASQSKLITYIYPLYPLAACVTAVWAAEYARRVSAMWIGLAACAIAAAGAAYALKLTWILHGLPAIAATGVGVFAAGALWTVLSARAPVERRAAMLALCAPAVIMTVLIPIAAAGPMWRNPDPKSVSATEVGRAVAANSRPGDRVIALTFDKPSVVYYSGRLIDFTDNQQVVGPLLSRPPYPLCVTKPDIITSLIRQHLLGRYKILERFGSQVVLIRGESPARGA